MKCLWAVRQQSFTPICFEDKSELLFFFMYIYPIKELIRLSSYYGDLESLQIPLILFDLTEKGIITYSAHGTLEAYCQKDK